MFMGRPKKYKVSATVNFNCEREFKDRLFGIAGRNNEPVGDVIQRAVNSFYPVSEDLNIKHQELLVEIERIEELQKSKQIQEEEANLKRLEEIEVSKRVDEINSKFGEYQRENRELMNDIYRNLPKEIKVKGREAKLVECIKRYENMGLDKNV